MNLHKSVLYPTIIPLTSQTLSGSGNPKNRKDYGFVWQGI